MKTDDILSRLEKVKASGSDPNQYVALCPAHEDDRHSLSVYAGERQALLYCHAGCSTESVVSALGLDMVDLWSEKDDIQETKYLYHTAEGTVAFEKIKKVVNGKKTFYQKGRNKQELLYRLPFVIGAVSADQEVWIVEGEKDAETLVTRGICGTTLADGANSKITPATVEPLKGAKVRIVGDNDDAGRTYVTRVVAALDGHALSVYVAYPPFGKDITDYLLLGGTLENLQWEAAGDEFVRKAKGDATAESLIGEIADVDSLGERARLAQLLSDIRPDLKKTGIMRAVNDLVKQRAVEKAQLAAAKFGVNLDGLPWALQDDGVYQLKWNPGSGTWIFDRNAVVATLPFWVAEKCTNENGEVWLHVQWEGGGKWIPKSVTASKEAICKELGAGPISGGRTTLVANYLTDTATRAKDLGVQATFCGWAGGKWYARQNVMNAPEPAKGNMSDWMDAFGLSYIADVVALLATASPFVRWTCKRNPVLGLIAETSTGKNTVVRWALAPWGRVVTLAAQSTTKGIQDAGHAAQDRPVFIDELQNLADDKIEQALYYVGTGIRRTTSSRAQVAVGGEQRWGVAVFASESPIEIGMRGGAVNRTVSIYERPLPEGLEHVYKMDVAAENVGWAVDEFDIEGMKDEMVDYFNAEVKRLAVREVGIGEMAALILVGARMLGVDFDVSRFVEMATSERGVASVEATTNSELQKILSILFSGAYVPKTYGLTVGEYRGPGNELLGWKLSDGRVDVLPTARVFSDFNMQRLSRMLAKNGLAERNGHHCTVPRKTTDGDLVRVLRVTVPRVDLS